MLSVLARATELRKQFFRLLEDRPTGIRIETRTKQPHADLNRHYGAKTLRIGAATALVMLASFLLYPEHIPTVGKAVRGPIVIQMEQIPETVQKVMPPAPPRPVVPLAAESDVPDTVTIEPTDLDLDAVPVDLAIAGPTGAGGPLSDEPIDGSELKEDPHVRRWPAALDLPPAIKKAGFIKVRLKLLIDERGFVKDVKFLAGPELARDFAIAQGFDYRFSPVVHEGRVRKVWKEFDLGFGKQK